MDVNSAKSLMEGMLVSYGLKSEGWRLGWCSGWRQGGKCDYGPKIISVSKDVTRESDWSVVRGLFLHEVAHALVGGEHGHDGTWRKMCKAIGGDGRRVTEVQRPTKSRW